MAVLCTSEEAVNLCGIVCRLSEGHGRSLGPRGNYGSVGFSVRASKGGRVSMVNDLSGPWRISGSVHSTAAGCYWHAGSLVLATVVLHGLG